MTRSRVDEVTQRLQKERSERELSLQSVHEREQEKLSDEVLAYNFNAATLLSRFSIDMMDLGAPGSKLVEVGARQRSGLVKRIFGSVWYSESSRYDQLSIDEVPGWHLATGRVTGYDKECPSSPPVYITDYSVLLTGVVVAMRTDSDDYLRRESHKVTNYHGILAGQCGLETPADLAARLDEIRSEAAAKVYYQK